MLWLGFCWVHWCSLPCKRSASLTSLLGRSEQRSDKWWETDHVAWASRVWALVQTPWIQVWLHYLLIVPLGQVIYSLYSSVSLSMESEYLFYMGVLSNRVINPVWHVHKFPCDHYPCKSYSSLFQSKPCLCWSRRRATWPCHGGTGLLAEIEPSRLVLQPCSCRGTAPSCIPTNIAIKETIHHAVSLHGHAYLYACPCSHSCPCWFQASWRVTLKGKDGLHLTCPPDPITWYEPHWS